jgi:hypothetical protein
MHDYPFLSLCWIDINISISFGLLYILLYFFVHQIDNRHNITFILELTGSNISLWWSFWKCFCLKLVFRNMFFSGS